MGTTTSSRSHAASGSGSDWRSVLGRIGLAAKGVLYLSLGVLALQFVYGTTSAQEASTSGAIEQIARQPFGRFLLIILTLGLAALALWNALRAATGDPVEGSDGKDRVKYAVQAITYAVITFTSAGILGANWGKSRGGGNQEQQATAVVLGWPGGQWLVGLAGLAAIALGLYAIYKHTIEEEFMARLARHEMDDKVESAVEGAGRAGYGARGLVFMVIGVLLIVAAIQHDPSEAGGLSEALQSLAGSTWGQVLLWLIAVGFFLYGLFALAEARYRRAV